jgi:SSS family solute:Na+ symporter
VAYDILVGGLLVPILGGLVWRRGTNIGAVMAMAAGTLATLVTMVSTDIFLERRRQHCIKSFMVIFQSP